MKFVQTNKFPHLTSQMLDSASTSVGCSVVHLSNHIIERSANWPLELIIPKPKPLLSIRNRVFISTAYSSVKQGSSLIYGANKPKQTTTVIWDRCYFHFSVYYSPPFFIILLKACRHLTLQIPPYSIYSPEVDVSVPLDSTRFNFIDERWILDFTQNLPPSAFHL